MKHSLFRTGLIVLMFMSISPAGLARADYWIKGGQTCRDAEGQEIASGQGCQPVRWPAGDVTYRIAADDVGAPYEFPDGVDRGSAVAAIRAAFEAWNAVPCSTLHFVEGERNGEPNLEPQNRIGFMPHLSVFFTDNPDLWASNDNVGTAQFIEDTELGIITGIIALNTKKYEWSASGEQGALDIQSIVSAMIGKHLGISSNTEGNATYAVYQLGNIDKRTLGADDIAAVQYLYGGDGCPTIPDPEQVCVRMLDPQAMCPPPVDPPDGFVDPDRERLPDVVRDGGPEADGDDDGCGCAIPGRTRSGAPIGLALLALIVIGRVRRRRGASHCEH